MLSACVVTVACLAAALDAPTTRLPASLSRRGALGAGAAAVVGLPMAAAASASLAPTPPFVERPEAGRFFVETILPPVPTRATYRYDLGRDTWQLEQLLSFQNVSATVRATVVRLEGGGLWVCAPVAPTGECLSLLRDLGPVEHIVLPVNALEHKALAGPFARAFPGASVWVCPGQYGPFGSLGFDAASSSLPFRVDGVLPRTRGDPRPPWAGEIETKLFYVDLPKNAGPVGEAAFFHKKSTSLLVTDAVAWIPRGDPPPIFRTVFGAGVDARDFWPKSVLQAVFLGLRQDADTGAWPGYDAISDRLVRAPILAAFADVRAPEETKRWVDDVCRWPFDRVVASHFASPISATGADFKAAFRQNANGLDARDWKQLDDLNAFIVANDLGAEIKADYH